MPISLNRRDFLKTSLAVGGAILFDLDAFSMPNDLDAFIEEVMGESHLPGLSACMVRDSDILWSKGYGWADIENKIPMTADIVQNIGSVSKTVTATALLQLWEKGRFELGDDVNDYLPFKVRNPRFPDIKITFRQLLTHRSSIKDGPAYGESYASGDPAISLELWCREYFTPGGKYYDRQENFHIWKPGETGEIPSEPRAYTNVGFGLLGYLVERISHESFGEYTKKHIFIPLDMKETSWYIRDIGIKRQAVPYIHVSAKNADSQDIRSLNETLGLYKNRPVEEGFLPLGLYSFPNIPDGLVRTSVLQLARFLMMYIGEGTYKSTMILQKATVETMLSEDHFGRGLCWNQAKVKNAGNVWFHSGGDPGISTVMMFNKESKTGVIIFTNGSGEGMGRIASRLYEEAGKL